MMPYRMLEELQNRKNEKVALFLTFENMVGLLLIGFPFFALTGGLPLLLRAPLVIGAGAIGVFLTMDVGGMAFYERILWWVRGMLRMRTKGRSITPTLLVGAPVQEKAPDPVLALDGPIQLARRERSRRGGPVVITTVQPRRAGTPIPDELGAFRPASSGEGTP